MTSIQSLRFHANIRNGKFLLIQGYSLEREPTINISNSSNICTYNSHLSTNKRLIVFSRQNNTTDAILALSAIIHHNSNVVLCTHKNRVSP